MDFGREGGCGGSYLAAPPTSARVQNRVEFVELARDMSSNCTGDVQAGTGISRWCQLSGCGTSSYHVTCSMNISTGICDCVRTHCGVRMAYHTWYMGTGITYVWILWTFILVTGTRCFCCCMAYDTWYLGAYVRYQVCIIYICLVVVCFFASWLVFLQFTLDICMYSILSTRVFVHGIYQRTDPPKRVLVCCAFGLRP